MADITARLAWYRLGEAYKSFSESWGGVAHSYNQFGIGRIDVLDMLLLGWLLAAIVVVGLINLYVKYVRRRGQRSTGIGGSGDRVTTAAAGRAVDAGSSDGETVRWLNAAVAWIRERHQASWLVEELLRGLTEESKRHMQGELQLRFDRAEVWNKMASVEFASVSTDVTVDKLLTILAKVTITEMPLTVATVRLSVTSFQTASYDIKLTRLCGMLQMQCNDEGEVVSLKFRSPPDLSLQVLSSNHGSTDQSLIESMVRAAVTGFNVNLQLPAGSNFQKLSSVEPTLTCLSSQTLRAEDDVISRQSILDRNTSERVRQWQQDREQRLRSVNSMTEPRLASHSEGRLHSTPSAPRTRGQRLLVKMIKANGLMNKDFAGSCDPYCTVSADEPPQQHMTSVVKNTINPFFDEHFLLNVTADTKQVKFEVFDRSKTKSSDDFLGRAVVAMDDLRRVPSSRQIIPLTGRSSNMSSTSGSITVEFLIMDGAGDSGSDAQSPEMLTAPYRYIETSNTVMPGGTLITTSTTTTDRLRDVHDEPGYNESPIRVEKSETSSSYTSQNSVIASQLSTDTSRTGPQHVGINSDGVTEVALRELSNQQRSLQPKTTMITMTGRPKEQVVPVINTVQAPSNDDPVHHNNSTHLETHETKKKSFASALKKRFGRNKNRTQSADRVPPFRDGSLLRPPNSIESTSSSRIPEECDMASSGSVRKSRSHSLSASFRNLFQRSKKANGTASRESSVSRASLMSPTVNTLRDESVGQPSPQLSTASQIRGIRQSTPEYSPQTGYPLSTSVPAKVSPLYQQ